MIRKVRYQFFIYSKSIEGEASSSQAVRTNNCRLKQRRTSWYRQLQEQLEAKSLKFEAFKSEDL
jgi:hypothetical protein